MVTQPDSSADSNRQVDSKSLSIPSVASIVLDFTVSLLVVGVGVLALSDPPGRQADSLVVAAFLVAGFGLGLATARLRQRSMVIGHMRDVHPGAPLPKPRS